MNNGGFSIYPSEETNLVSSNGRAKRQSTSSSLSQHWNQQFTGSGMADEDCNPYENRFAQEWNAREEVRLLDAVEQFGYGNWKDIAQHVETKSLEQTKN